MVVVKSTNGATTKVVDSKVVKDLATALTRRVQEEFNGSIVALSEKFKLDADCVKRIMAENVNLDAMNIGEYKAICRAAGYSGNIMFEMR